MPGKNRLAKHLEAALKVSYQPGRMRDGGRLLDSNHDTIATIVNNKYGRCVKKAFSLQGDKRLTMHNH